MDVRLIESAFFVVVFKKHHFLCCSFLFFLQGIVLVCFQAVLCHWTVCLFSNVFTLLVPSIHTLFRYSEVCQPAHGGNVCRAEIECDELHDPILDGVSLHSRSKQRKSLARGSAGRKKPWYVSAGRCLRQGKRAKRRERALQGCAGHYWRDRHPGVLHFGFQLTALLKWKLGSAPEHRASA